MGLFCTICAMMPFEVHLRDISQAFLQSETFLRRKIYAKPPLEMNLPDECVLVILRPLYGVPESPIRWYKTYHNHHTVTLRMKALETDPCFLYKIENGRLVGVVTLQVDDSSVGGTCEFRELENNESNRFTSKPVVPISSKAQTFNGVMVSWESDGSYICPRKSTSMSRKT
jgi:hypothetical protein